jgi:hypothetical protein
MILQLHHVPGRLRIRLAKLKHNQKAAAALRSELLAIRGIKSVSLNSATGSIITYYDRNSFELNIFWQTLRRLSYIDQEPKCSLSHKHADTGKSASMATMIISKALLAALLEQWVGRQARLLISLIA